MEGTLVDYVSCRRGVRFYASIVQISPRSGWCPNFIQIDQYLARNYFLCHLALLEERVKTSKSVKSAEGACATIWSLISQFVGKNGHSNERY